MEKQYFPHLVAVEDDEGVRESLEVALESFYELHFFTSAEKAFEHFRTNGRVDLVLMDVLLPGMNGLDALSQIKKSNPGLPVVMLSAVGDAATGVRAIKSGAYDYIVKPFMVEELRNILSHALQSSTLSRENVFLKKELSEKFSPSQLIGKSSVIREVREKISQAASSLSNVLITGETGTGKELVAKAIHYASGCSSGPFLAMNCAALPRDLVESELFGHEKGAFTGATQTRIGAFEQAQGGTLFLDEIGELSVPFQAKLLRVLEERKIQRIGGTHSISLNVRLISATNKDLEASLEKGDFRKDLYYRICVFPIHIAPLRERLEDIPHLVENRIETLQKEMGLTEKPVFTEELMDAFRKYSWPGNIRELKNVIEAMILSHKDLKPLRLGIRELCKNRLKELSDVVPGSQNDPDYQNQRKSQNFNGESSLKDALDVCEKEMILKTLEKTRWNITAASLALKVSPRVLRYRMNRLKIKPDIQDHTS